MLFLVQEPLMLDHFRGIWNRLDNRKFVIGLHQKMDSGVIGFEFDTIRYREELVRSGYTVTNVSDLLRLGQRFRWVVSNHKMGTLPSTRLSNLRDLISRGFRLRSAGRRTQAVGRWLNRLVRGPVWIPQKLGSTQIRMMYGPDLSPSWSLQNWNQMYSYALCHGPKDSDLLSEKFGIKCFQIGYPKYDRFFSNELNLRAVRQELELLEEPKVLVWLPTAGKNSIPDFLNLIIELGDHYQVICRPHPLSLNDHENSLRELRKKGILVDDHESREMVNLISVADFLLVDSGGSPFGGLYLNKKVVLMVGPTSAENEVSMNSTNDALRTLYPSITQGDSAKSVMKKLEDEDFWRDILYRARLMRSDFFAPFDGCSSEQAVTVLEKITGLRLKAVSMIGPTPESTA